MRLHRWRAELLRLARGVSLGNAIAGIGAGLTVVDRISSWARRRRLTPRERRDLCLWRAGRKREVAARIEHRNADRARSLRRQADELEREARKTWAPLITD